MNRKKGICLILVVLLLTSLLSGCGKDNVEVPELKDPVAVRESYRPVDYGDVGKIELIYGEVVPVDYSYFWKVATTINTIPVRVGDYVEAGTVLAYADIGTIKEDVAAIREQISYKNQLFQVSEESYTYKNLELQYASAVASASNQKEKIDEAANDLAVAEENHRFDVQLHEFEIEQLNDQIDELNKLADKETLVADVSGYVTYIKDMSVTNHAGAFENVVVVSDMENSYIELSNITMASLSRSRITIYENYYTEINAERRYLEEYEYTPEEQVIIENKMKYPNIRMKLKDGGALPPIGTTLPIFMTTSAEQNVLCVGNDSLYSDEGGDYVYVKEGDMKSVRYVTIGKKGSSYTEIISGVEAGELVSYIVTNLLPDDYTPYEVVLGDYTPKVIAKNYKKEGSLLNTCYSDYAGEVVTVNAREQKVVQAGDVICQIKTEVGSAKLTELSDALDTLQENYNLQIDGYAKQKEGIYQATQYCAYQYSEDRDAIQYQIDSGMRNGVALTPAELEGLKQLLANRDQVNSYSQLQYQMQTKQVECSERMSEITFQYAKKCKQKEYAKAGKDNDGAGIIDIYAQADGTLVNTDNVKEEKMIRKGDLLFCLVNTEKDIVTFTSMTRLRLGQEILFKAEDGVEKEFIGKVVGIANPNKVYLTADDTATYITENVMTANAPTYYIQVDDNEFYTAPYSITMSYAECSFSGVVTVPRGTVKTEVVEDKTYQYVWKISDGILVKTFVRMVEDDNTNRVNECIISGIKPGDVLALEN